MRSLQKGPPNPLNPKKYSAETTDPRHRVADDGWLEIFRAFTEKNSQTFDHHGFFLKTPM